MLRVRLSFLTSTEVTAAGLTSGDLGTEASEDTEGLSNQMTSPTLKRMCVIYCCIYLTKIQLNYKYQKNV